MYEGDLPPSNIMQAAVRQIARDAEDEERWGDEDCGNGDQSSFVEDGVEDLETNAIEAWDVFGIAPSCIDSGTTANR